MIQENVIQIILKISSYFKTLSQNSLFWLKEKFEAVCGILYLSLNFWFVDTPLARLEKRLIYFLQMQ